MSYRTYINGCEWLGNNEQPEAIIKELKRQGCPFDADLCTQRDILTGERVAFEVKDLQSLVEATEQAILNEYEYQPEIADFRPYINTWKHNLTYGMRMLFMNRRLCWSAFLLECVGKENYTISFKKVMGKGLREVYTLKPGAKCLFEAF